MSRTWLWWINGAGMLAIAAAAIAEPVVINSGPCGGPVCDPHGYILIFTTLPAAGVAIFALVALSLLSVRQRVGFGAALGAAVACALSLVWNGIGLSARFIVLTAALSLVVAALAIAGLRLVREPPRPALVEPPYPPLA